MPLTQTREGHPCDCNGVLPGNVEEYISRVGPTAEVPRCGITQREFTWNRGCEETVDLLSFGFPIDVGYFDDESGASLVEAAAYGEVQCLAREPRQYRADCPGGLVCTAGGECVPDSRSDLSIVSLDPPH